MLSFDPVADAYAAARPTYPDALFDALEAASRPLAGALVVEGGAGTGLATRTLVERGATVVAIDVGEQMLHHNTGVRVVADGARAPLRNGAADLVCFAQAWHWLDEDRRCDEAARVLRPGGWWAGWWNHPRADGDPWFERYWDVIEARTVGRRAHRDVDWGAGLDGERFGAPRRTTVPWIREIPLEVWLTDERSKSYIGFHDERDEIVAALEGILRDEFGDGPVRVRYETWLWVAARR